MKKIIDWELIKAFGKKIIDWELIATLGKNQLVKRSYIFFFFVPIAAKILSEVSSPIEIIIGRHKFTFLFELPFSWKIFFFSALCFAVGSLIYEIFAPKIIKENKSLGDFWTAQKNMAHLKSYIEDLYISDAWINSIGLKPEEIKGKSNNSFYQGRTKAEKEKLNVYINFHVNLVDYNKLVTKRMEAVQSNFGTPVNISESHHSKTESQFIEWSFWTIFYYAKTCRLWLRVVAGAAYLFGFLLLLWMICKNIQTVYSM